MREETPFDASLLGGAVERRYRTARPEVEALPWGTLDVSLFHDETRRAGGRAWTISAFQEHRTAAACAETVSALVPARAPLDLVAMATRFPLDEIVTSSSASGSPTSSAVDRRCSTTQRS